MFMEEYFHKYLCESEFPLRTEHATLPWFQKFKNPKDQAVYNMSWKPYLNVWRQCWKKEEENATEQVIAITVHFLVGD